MSGQPNPGALGGGDWRASITEQVRRQNLINIVTPILQGLSEQHSVLVMNHSFQLESQAYGAANSSQEYVMLLNSKVMELSQKIKLVIASQASGASAGSNVAGQGSGAVNPAPALMQNTQFNQQANAPTQAQHQAHGQAQPQPQVQAPGAPAGAQPSAESIVPQIRNIIQNPDNHSIQDLTMTIRFLQAQSNTIPDKQLFNDTMGKLIFATRKKQQQQQQSQPQLQQQQQQQQPQQQQQQQAS
ncbi:hypothetical protein GGI22_003656, partial [Coemansia erecta]